MKFEVKYFGQTVIKYQVPYDIFLTLNHIYETNYNKLEPANKGLAGKIQNEINFSKIAFTNIMSHEMKIWMRL